MNRRWQLKAGVYPKEDNSVRDGGFPANSSLAGPFPSYIVVAPYISAGMSLLLSPAVQNGAYFSLVIYKAAGGFEAEELMLVEMEIVAEFFQ